MNELLFVFDDGKDATIELLSKIEYVSYNRFRWYRFYAPQGIRALIQKYGKWIQIIHTPVDVDIGPLLQEFNVQPEKTEIYKELPDIHAYVYQIRFSVAQRFSSVYKFAVTHNIRPLHPTERIYDVIYKIEEGRTWFPKPLPRANIVASRTLVTQPVAMHEVPSLVNDMSYINSEDEERKDEQVDMVVNQQGNDGTMMIGGGLVRSEDQDRGQGQGQGGVRNERVRDNIINKIKDPIVGLIPGYCKKHLAELKNLMREHEMRASAALKELRKQHMDDPKVLGQLGKTLKIYEKDLLDYEIELGLFENHLLRENEVLTVASRSRRK
jgi:hypothetical protein